MTGASVSPPLTGTQRLDRARTDRANLFDVERFGRGIDEHGLDAVVAFSGPNVTYSCGIITRGDETPEVGVTTSDGRQALIAAQDFAMLYDAYSWVNDVRGYPHGGDAQHRTTELLVEALIDLGLERARIGLEKPLPEPAASLLQERMPNASWIPAHEVFARARAIKTPGEIALYRVAASLTIAAVERAWQTSRAGDTEKSISARIQSLGLEFGADFTSHCQLQAGAHSTIAMAPSLERPVAPGEIVHVDYGGRFAGYVTDIARNAVVVAAGTKEADVYRRLLEVHEIVLHALAPGATGAEVWAAGTRACEVVGLAHPWTSFGHGIGLDIHEGIEFTESCTDVLEPGMIVCAEPSHFAPEGRYHVEDIVLIAADGAEPLTFTDATDGSDDRVARAMNVIAG